MRRRTLYLPAGGGGIDQKSLFLSSKQYDSKSKSSIIIYYLKNKLFYSQQIFRQGRRVCFGAVLEAFKSSLSGINVYYRILHMHRRACNMFSQ